MKSWCTLLSVAVEPSVIAFAYVLFVQGHTAAFNSHIDEYRKWPWRAGVESFITTCPGRPPHAGNWWAAE